MDEWSALIRRGKLVEQRSGGGPTAVAEAAGQAAENAPSVPMPEVPPVPRNIQETGLSESHLIDLVLKTLNLRGTCLGHEICEEIKLPYQGVMQHIMTFLKEERLCEIQGGAGLTELTWNFRLTERGTELAQFAARRDGYVGPAPVELSTYVEWAAMQKADWSDLHEAEIRAATSHLVLNDDTINRVGPAFTSGKPILIYGNAGNGKTILAEALATCLPDSIFVPHAIEAGSQTIRLYDAAQHHIVQEPPADIGPAASPRRDHRWVRIKRPFIVVGGELTFQMLGLTFDPDLKSYIAPVQMKANGGILLIDDFGRQRVSPVEVLNRWIIPMEKSVDYHVLASGVQIRVPFNVMLIFSTNLSPGDLVDEAFLRRIRYKMMIQDPSEEQYREIFRRVCEAKGVPMDEEMLEYLVAKHYKGTGRPFRASQPRDLLEQMIDIAHYKGTPPELSHEAIDAACHAYFVL